MGFNDSISVRAGSPYIVGDNETKIPFNEQTELFSGQGDRGIFCSPQLIIRSMSILKYM
jgi:hypothetical protein